MLLKIRRAQSILEYAVLIAIVVAAIVIMQVFIKRGVSGRLKDSADRISGGQLFSASNSTTKDTSEMTTERTITSMTAIDSDGTTLAGSLAGGIENIDDIVTKGAYSAGGSSGGETTSTSQARMDDATKEAFTQDQMTGQGQASDMNDFADPTGE